MATTSALAIVRDYYAIRDQLRKNPEEPLARLSTVAISSELTAQRALFRRERRDGWHQTGDTRIAKIAVESVNLTNSNPKAGEVPIVQVDVCYDVSDVDVLDARGESVVEDARPETGWIRYSVGNYDYAEDPTGAWRVASSQNLERTPCDAT